MIIHELRGGYWLNITKLQELDDNFLVAAAQVTNEKMIGQMWYSIYTSGWLRMTITYIYMICTYICGVCMYVYVYIYMYHIYIVYMYICHTHIYIY